MQDLRLVGVHDDGEHLLLSGAGGEMFQLPIDEALRAGRQPACRRSRSGGRRPLPCPRGTSRRRSAVAPQLRTWPSSPGMPLAKVERYEGPVLAEREYVAQQARKVEVASPSPGHDVYRSVFGDNPATLGDMVAHRLSAHGIESRTRGVGLLAPAGRHLDRRRPFAAAPGGHASIGEEPPAMWTFNPARKSLQNANRWAQQLSELEPLGRTRARPPALRGVRQAFRLRNRRRSRGPQWHWCRRRQQPRPS